MLKKIILFLINHFFPSSFFKIKRNKIVADSFLGRPFSGNAKYIVERLIEIDPSLDIVWLSLDNQTPLPRGVRSVKYNSLRSVYEMATAKIWIDDFRKKYFPKKKKGQIYFQTWHGFITLKHVERDAVNSLTTEYLKQAKRDAMNSDYMLSGTRNTTKLYLNSFWFNGEVLEFGTPRMDEILKPNSANIAKVNVALNLSEEDNILLYAPTFRENSKKAFDIYNLNFDDLRVRLEKRFGGNWKIVVKLHPNIKELESKLIGNGTCIGASNFDNIQSLILRARIVVTDFSSLMFDAMVAGKIVSLYAPDADEYEAKRGLYFKISELPFDLAKNGEMLAEHLVNFDKLTYKNNIKMFEKKIGLLEDGNASQRVAEYILEKMNE